MLPAGVRLVGIVQVGADAVRGLDDRLRQDIPGSDGWQWTPEGFAAETGGDDYDPAVYRVAQEVDGGELVGLVRVWTGRDGPCLRTRKPLSVVASRVLA